MATLLNRLAPLVLSVRQHGTAVVEGGQTIPYDLTVNAKHFEVQSGRCLSVNRCSHPVRFSCGWIPRTECAKLQFAFTVSQVGPITKTSNYTHFGLPVQVAIPQPAR